MEQLHVETKTNESHAIFLNQDADYYYSIGGRYSAKTWEIIQKNVIDALNEPGLRIAAGRKVFASIRDTLYADFLKVIRSIGLDGRVYSATVSPLGIKFANGSEVIFKGADDPEKTKGLSGVHRLILDELNEYTLEDFESYEMSIRGDGYKTKIYMAHNPIPMIPGSRYWFQDLFDPGSLVPGEPVIWTDTSLGRVAALKTTYRQNFFCPEKVKLRLEGYRETNPSLYKLWALGEYAEMKGVILKNWDVVQTVPEGAPLIGYGLDFGFSDDPAACVKVWGNKEEIWVKCLCYSTGLVNRELFEHLKRHGVGATERIVADSAEPKSIEDLFRLGLRGIRGVKKRANYKAEMAHILQGMKIHLVSGSTDMQREFSTWSWDEDKTGKLLPRPKDGNDHAIDSLIMLMHDYRGSNRAVGATVTLRV